MGYILPKHLDNVGRIKFDINAKVMIKVKDLTLHSRVLITEICSNPNCTIKEMTIPYENYCNLLVPELGLYYCCNCTNVKRFEVAKLKQQNQELKRGDKYYWHFKENILKELNAHIKKYKTLVDISKTDNVLLQAINEYFPRQISTLIEEIGYVYSEISDYDPHGYYNDKEKVLSDILKFINKHNRFPSKQDFNTADLKVPVSQMVKHCGSLEKLRKYLNYIGDNELLTDNRGDVNRSVCELYVANWLIAQGLKEKYTREQYPFLQDGQYRSDFTLYLTEEQKEIHIEVWGHLKGDKSSRGEDYNKNRCIKESLYESASGKSLVVFIQNKSGGIQYFANKYNLPTHYKLNQWNESKIYETFEYIIHTYKVIPATKKINKLKKEDNKLKGFIAYIDNNGGFVFWKDKFYKYCEENNIAI